MIFTVKKASDWNYTGSVDLKTAEDIQKFSELYKEDLIISFSGVDGKPDPRITIYDDYVE